MNDYLPLSYLNAREYCPRRFYLEYMLGEMADNEHILLHRKSKKKARSKKMIPEFIAISGCGAITSWFPASLMQLKSAKDINPR
ncbi:hypothetical protein JOY44_01750 [Phormidium sp. CLA17]|uniref:hypothetical protein n=1 Tax=Leptolyngbya sp. Cla-17 TaxID=2803751 RepID=UPI0018D5BAA2|nr:hypothetical protein [Leptolyngbya sp. Cla-17]MBM0740353.1 hypothetical protein [Leptolyngbya sp. Cla-17]